MVLLLLAATPAAASDKGLWFDFTPYPSGRLLCTEVVVGSKGEHITWRTLAVQPAPAKVAAFYEKEEHTTATRGDHGSYHLSAEEDRVRVKMTVYGAGVADRFPHCDERPARGERTVILISQKI
jgi:hypothetical protein